MRDDPRTTPTTPAGRRAVAEQLRALGQRTVLVLIGADLREAVGGAA